MSPLTVLFWIAGGLFLFSTTGGCRRASRSGAQAEVLSVWAHAGRADERRILQRQVSRFNEEHPEFQAQLTFLPEGSYNGQVQAAAVAGELPAVLELDGPYVANYAWQGKLRALDPILGEKLHDDLLPSLIEQGTYRDSLYAIGTFDSGLGLYAHRKALEAVGARIPRSAAEAWSVREFEEILASLASHDADGMVLDLGLNNIGEWYSYGFSPVLQSAGGDLVARGDSMRAEGILDGPESIAALQHIQDWIVQGYVDPNLDDAAFTAGRVGLSWSGHWKFSSYCPKGDCGDVVLVPLPDFGRGSRTGQGSWCWSITRECKNPELAMAFLRFLLRTPEILAMTNSNHAVPGTKSAVAASADYGMNGPLHLFASQLSGGYAVPRPRTPAYPIISSAFQKALLDIRAGGSVKKALHRAARVIDRDLADNHGYPDPQAARRDGGEGKR